MDRKAAATRRHVVARFLPSLMLHQMSRRDVTVSTISYTVPANYTAPTTNSSAPFKNHNEITTDAYGNAFDLALSTTTNKDGSTTDTLTYKNYSAQTNGSFSAVSDTGSGSDLASAYQSLLAAMQGNGDMTDGAASQLKDGFSQLESKSQNGSKDATVSGGYLVVAAGGPHYFNGISSAQNNAVDSIINDLSWQLVHNPTA
jgi:hypothetical protein